jgi:hypothetical protein
MNENKDDDQPRLKATANLLHPHIKCLACLMSRYRVIIDELNPNELGVTLFLYGAAAAWSANKRGELDVRLSGAAMA